ncbi:MAG: histidine kinase [Aquificaceae bacterium]|nr:histidine kinase [Aquificaceae bacterium]MCX8059587.1 histidine kinase [Aquificaceae bacterium]MDW8096714.1 histidine kinase [Aquificaceae bacterium]
MLKVRLREWLYILLLALLLGFSISGFVASLHGEAIGPVVALGVLTSCYIFALSLITTEIYNRWLIAWVPSPLRTPFSLLFAFLSGFVGALGGYLSNELLGITSIKLSFKKALSLSFFLGVMTSSLGYLLYKLLSLQRKEEESRGLLLEEHIRSLEAQIAPHFMFNTLNAVAELVWQDPARAERAILSLARLLRKSLHLEPYITLEEELELLKDYWSLMSLRFVGSISLEIQTDPKMLNLRVPKFSLQVLVENAVKHGLKLRHGYVKVRAYRRDSEQVVEVEDNGVGFETLKEGVGLRNLRKRLALCGGRLDYRSEDGTTCFRMLFNGR